MFYLYMSCTKHSAKRCLYVNFIILPPREPLNRYKKFEKGTDMAGICKEWHDSSEQLHGKKRCTIKSQKENKKLIS